jgi:hypothetical protein
MLAGVEFSNGMGLSFSALRVLMAVPLDWDLWVHGAIDWIANRDKMTTKRVVSGKDNEI